MGPPENEKLLESKGHGQQDKTAAYRKGDLHQPHIRQRSDLQNIQRTQVLSSKEQIIQLKKWGTDLNRELSTEESKMAERHLRKCSASLVIREMQIKQL